jgi:type I restriction enzyme S subunit
MKSNYRPIGEYIREIDSRNKGLKVKQLLGLSISKQFIPSVANIIGTAMENYKIIRENQFACSTMQVRRDGKMPIALLHGINEAIISQAYPVFEVKNANEIIPEYLMMWFSRSEFDREACFYAVGGVRGSLEWEDFLNMKLPVPHPDKQREIVAEYNTIQNRIKLNERMIQKLEETAQAIYREWFVEFEFPDENGKPYKSNGGELIWSEELKMEIPKGWSNDKLKNLTLKITDGTHSTVIDSENGEYFLLSCKNIKNNCINFSENDRRIDKNTLDYLRKRTGLTKHDILLTTVGSIGEVAQIKTEFIPYELQRSVAIIRPDINILSHQFLYQYTKSQSFKEQVNEKSSGSVQTCLFLGSINEIEILIPNEPVISRFDKISDLIHSFLEKKIQENKSLLKLKDILLTKMATITYEN